MDRLGALPPELDSGAEAETEPTFAENVSQSEELRYPLADHEACGTEISGAVPPELTSGDAAVTMVTVPAPNGPAVTP